jgi:bifunctional non-homologous end joining protein LigD
MGKTAQVDEALTRYRQKRCFTETREPRGSGKPHAQSGLYVIQKHDATRLHYDFRLELDGVLLSWAVTRGPSYDTSQKRLAVRTEDHPLEYGNFEGTIPKSNYGGGTVMLWDTGRWKPLEDPHTGLDNGKLAFELHGERLRGRWALVRMRQGPKDKHENWLLIKEKDEFANTHPDLLESEIKSVVSGRKMDEIARADQVWGSRPGTADLPAFVEPMLATLVDKPPRGPGWLFEVKYDGYRALIAADHEHVKIFTRTGLDWTHKFPDIAKAFSEMRLLETLLDSEIVVIDESGRTDFGALVEALESGKKPFSCFVFDLLVLEGEDFRQQPLSNRKARLKQLIGQPDKAAPVQYSEVFAGDGAALLNSACTHGLEGLIAKRVDKPYRSGRHKEWLKIKCGYKQEFVVIGFSASERHRSFASLLLAVQEPEGLRYAGRIGSGFSQATLMQLSHWRDRNTRKTPPCDVPVKLRRGVTWVKPELVAEVDFAGWTRDRLIRQGRFIGLREDKKPDEAVREIPMKTTANIHITHADRIVYPDCGITKADIAAYVQTASSLMLPFVSDRFISLVRCPEGMAEKCFFQRHLMPGFGKAWHTAKLTKNNDDEDSYMYFSKLEALIAAVQMGVLEFHIWGARRTAANKPDRIVFDLDPDPSVSFEAVKTASFRLRDILGALDLQSMPLLSGGKGIHVVVPVIPSHEWPAVKDFSAALAARLVADEPNKYTDTMSKAKRQGKIFIDYFRNEITATAIAPYSPRARPGAPVAWPVSWAGLRMVESADAMTISKAKAAIEAGENGWVDYNKIHQRLSVAAVKAVVRV